MANMTAGGKPIDARSQLVKQKRVEYEIDALRNSIKKQQIDILEAELNIERMQESIEGTEKRIQVKQVELEKFTGGEIDV